MKKEIGHYVGDSSRPKVEILFDRNGMTSDEIWSIPVDADAIRNAGIRCKTCRHYTEAKLAHFTVFHCAVGQSRDDYMDNEVEPDHFCANHSELK